MFSFSKKVCLLLKHRQGPFTGIPDYVAAKKVVKVPSQLVLRTTPSRGEVLEHSHSFVQYKGFILCLFFLIVDIVE